MKKIYRVRITGDKYPLDFNVEASGWATAIARAVREWGKSSAGKGSRTNKLTLTAIKSTPLLLSEEK